MEERKPRARHTFAAILAVGVVGLFVWVIQLARQGDPVGYIILTGTGMLIFLLVTGIVFHLVMSINQPPRHHSNNLKTIYDTQRVMDRQNRALADQLNQMQKYSAPPAGQAGRHQDIELRPGQMMTASGYVIEDTAFDALDEE